MENLPSLYYFEKALEREGLRDSTNDEQLSNQNFDGFYDETVSMSDDSLMAETQEFDGGIYTYDETGSENYLNARGKTDWGKIGIGLGAAAAAVGGTLLVSDLVNKEKDRKRKAEEARNRAQQEASDAEKKKQQLLADQQAADQAALIAASQGGQKPPKNKTLLYAGIAVGVLAVTGVIIAVARK
jgi:hypothetical protein